MSELALVRTLKTPYADLLPPLSEDERRALAADLLDNGQQTPVLIDEHGNILDGHNRYAILGERVTTKMLSGMTEAEKWALIFRTAEGRRNLTQEQKRRLFLLKKSIAFELREQDPQRYTQQRIADKLGVSREAISKWFTTNGKDTNGCDARPDARVKLAPEQRERAVQRVDAGEPQAAVAADFGVTQQAVSKVVVAARPEAAIKSKRSVDHDARNASVRELHDQGLGTSEIAKRLNLASPSVSHVKIKLGIAATSAPLKLWTDVDHITTVLEGAALNIDSVAARLEEATELAAEPEEIRRCIKSLSNTCKTARRLLSALRQRSQ